MSLWGHLLIIGSLLGGGYLFGRFLWWLDKRLG